MTSSVFPTLQVTDLTVQFPTPAGWVTVVEDVSFTVPKRSFVGLVGESGSGKSVTAAAIGGLVQLKGGRVATGVIDFNGRDLARVKERELRRIRGRDIGYIFQQPMSSLNPSLTVGEQIAEVVRRHRRRSRATAFDHATGLLDRVGIASARERAKDYPHQFSGGMLQRVMIAVALACNPELLIADEPTTALDVTTQAQFLRLLRQIQEEQELSVLLITHDLGVVADLADAVVVMYGGQTIEKGAVNDIFYTPRHPYTAALLDAMPLTALLNRQPLRSIPGTVPLPEAMPTGCHFQDRCTYVESRCREEPVVEFQRGVQSVRCLRTDELATGLARSILGKA